MLPENVIIQEVALRDGLQNEKRVVATADKLRLVERMIGCGIRRIELSSFVNPRLVPQMADAEELWRKVRRHPDVLFTALILNERGLDRAISCGVPHVGIYVSASETHSRKNSNMNIAEALKEARLLLRKARSEGVRTRAGVMNAFGCAYEGAVPLARTLEITQGLLEEDPEEICLADSSGLANPLQIRKYIEQVRENTAGKALSLHLHNTRGLGPANLYAALEEGVSIFDTSLGGLGGCPFISGARGNISTEDTVYMIAELGISTGIDLKGLIRASRDFEALMGQNFPAVISHIES